jgi:serine/threonine-protein kinase RsbW
MVYYRRLRDLSYLGLFGPFSSTYASINVHREDRGIEKPTWSRQALVERIDTETSLRIEAKLDNLNRIRHFVEERATKLGADPAAVSDVVLAINEAATNIVVHGYQKAPGLIEIEVRRKGGFLEVDVRDHAPAFDPTTVPAPDLTLPLDQRPYGGLGIFLIRKLVDKVIYRITAQGGNELTLVKRLTTP